MKKDRLTPRGDRRKINRSVSPQNVVQKVKGKEYFPAAKKENIPHNTKDKHSLQICLDLASYHKKEAEQMKQKNQSLEERLKEQSLDMEKLRTQLQKIKLSIQNTTSKKEMEALRKENITLRTQNIKITEQIALFQKQVQELTDQNLSLKSKGKEAESVLIESQSRCDNGEGEVSSFTVAKMSRRQQYANKYESISFVPSIRCLECARKENELEQVRTKYSKELLSLQEEVKVLQRSQTDLEVMQRQISSKNECIDYLIKQLNSLEADSEGILKNMTFLQQKMKDVTDQNIFLKGSGLIHLQQSFSKTVA